MKKTVILFCLICLSLLLLCACSEVTPSGETPGPGVGDDLTGGNTGGSSHVHYLTQHEAVAPVCGTPGNIEYWECVGCGAYFADAEGELEISNPRAVRLESTEHTFEIAYNETEHWKAYTCACRLYPDTYESHSALEPCAFCGYQPGTNGLQYTLNGNGDAYAVSGIGQASGDIVIASIYNGLPVTEIAAQAFAGVTKITAVDIPESVTVIGAHAFRACTGIRALEIPGGITEIDESVFSMCENLQSVTFLPPTEGGESEITEIGQWAFRGCKNLTSIVIPPHVTTVAYNTFYDCTALESVTLPEGLVSIDSYAFDGCTQLSDLIIPAGVVNIGAGAFNNCEALIQTENGVQYVGKWVVGADSTLRTVTDMREDTVGIAFGAFSTCRALTFVEIPASVVYIGSGAFEGCAGLTAAVFENRVGWYGADIATADDGISIYSSDLLTPSTAAIYLTSTYVSLFWKCE